ncbi:MAG: hypothetical protein JO135_07775, partial [Candidatus Eremiobacteraeota bacterium]|nr:hypothetical protein [Candidatus Eremiobacteraeota bacterium]
PLTLNLPGVQVRDLAINTREGELIAATHGRAFWILDNIALLEQLARQTTHSVAYPQLFAPETAWMTQSYGRTDFPPQNSGNNPRYGARVFFNLPPNYNGRTPAILSILDAKGTPIRSLRLHLAAKKTVELSEDITNSKDAAYLRERAEREATGVKPGMNAFQWDLKYPPAFDPPGYNNDTSNDWPDTGDGPTVLPGTYTVALQYGSQRLQAPLTVALDPRVHPAGGELEARLAFESQIVATIDSLDRSIAAAQAARSHLSPARRAEVDAEISKLVLLHGSSSEYDVVYPDRLREQLGSLLNSLEVAYAKPTSAEIATYEDLKTEVAAGEARLKTLSK